MFIGRITYTNHDLIFFIESTDDQREDQRFSFFHQQGALRMLPLTLELYTAVRLYQKMQRMKSGLLSCGCVRRNTHQLHQRTICI